MKEEELKEEQIAWLKQHNGMWFWRKLAQWAKEYRYDASAIEPMRDKKGEPEEYAYFEHRKRNAAARAIMCDDILSFVQELLDTKSGK